MVLLDWLVLCQPWPYSNPSPADQRDYAAGSRAVFVVSVHFLSWCGSLLSEDINTPAALHLDSKGFKVVMFSLVTQDVVFCPCPRLAEGKPVSDSTVHREGKELWAHQVSTLLHLHKSDVKLIKQAILMTLCFFLPKHWLHPVHSTKSRHNKESSAAAHVSQ